MPERRDFRRRSGIALAGAGATIGPGDTPRSGRIEGPSADAAEHGARDETYWHQVRRGYVQSPHFVNLESGYYSPAPESTLEGRIRGMRELNEIPSLYMRTRQAGERSGVKRRLAGLAGCSTEELVITRNTTEALDTVILGLRLAPGDEAVLGRREYPNMRASFAQKARREGIRLRWVDVPEIPSRPDEVVGIYERAITPRTRVILVSHIINLNGQILPVRRICDMAHARGVEVIVDGAHSFAQLDFEIPALGCDYFGTSLHKWLAAPLGTGLLYVRKEKIHRVWPLFGDDEYGDDDIRKFERVGTQPVSARLSIAHAVRFHEEIGSARKEARLRYLKDFWTDRVRELPGVRLHTPRDRAQSCAIAALSIAGISPRELSRRLFEEHRIFTVATGSSVRVTPNLHNGPCDLDRLVAAIRALAAV